MGERRPAARTRHRPAGRPSTKPRQKPVGDARAVALDIIAAVLRRRVPLDEALEASRAFRDLPERDRAFARNLTATVFRRLGQIDAVIAEHVERPLPPRAADVTDGLRLGAAQILFLETPPHAAVDTAVRLVRRHRQGNFAGLVNAVLRRVADHGPAHLAAQDAARLNTPDWLWESWREAYGDDTCRRIADAHLGEPPLDITVKEDAERWAEALGATVLPTGSLRLHPRGAIPALSGFREGAWWVQDAAAALPARLLDAKAGMRVADLCAAPGGKTAQLAATGAEVIAVERSERRLARLTENLARLGLSADTVCADAAAWHADAPLDAVLLDVPCSATGTLRRHPDAAWLRTPGDVASLVPVQAALLKAAVDMLRPGGTLVFCACSLQPEEGPQHVDTLIAAGAPVERVPVRAAEVGGLAETISPAGDLRTLPCHLAREGGIDGFFAARLRRT